MTTAEFEVSSKLQLSPEEISEIFTMQGVNRELTPLLRIAELDIIPYEYARFNIFFRNDWDLYFHDSVYCFWPNNCKEAQKKP